MYFLTSLITYLNERSPCVPILSVGSPDLYGRVKKCSSPFRRHTLGSPVGSIILIVSTSITSALGSILKLGVYGPVVITKHSL